MLGVAVLGVAVVVVAGVAALIVSDRRDEGSGSAQPAASPVALDSSTTAVPEPLLLEPHVSVALDPEWRVGPSDVPKAGRIGAVTGGDVNRTIDYLDELAEANGLPPKMLIVHQFVDRMIVDKESIRGTDNVQVVLHMDGFGPLRLKRDTYAKVTADLPDGVLVGWKNVYDEDDPTPTPTDTMAADPLPTFVSFQ